MTDASPEVVGAPRPARRSTPVRLLLRFVAVAAVLAVVGVLLLVLHFRSTPTFAEYLRIRKVPEHVFAFAGPGSIVGEGRWATGSVDPFALAGDDPRHARDTMSFEVEIKHAEEVLLRLVLEVTVAEEKGSGKRIAAACRTVQMTTGPELRAEARVFLHDLDRVLEPSGGAVTFDVLLGAGDGPDRCVVVDAPRDALPTFAPGDPLPNLFQDLLPDLVVRMLPWVDRTAEGLLHHVQAIGELSWLREEGSSGGAGLGAILHDVNTQEYSYEITAKLVDRSRSGSQCTRDLYVQRVWTWNGTVW